MQVREDIAKKIIRKKTVYTYSFKAQMDWFLRENDINRGDVIGITSKGDFTTLWYWGQ
ncbi:MAG: hypothetical protein ACR2MT_05740 [Aurantibacter sp.]